MTGPDYPRVLVIDPVPFNRITNNGIVKSALFQGWPEDRLAQIDYSNIEPGFDVCRRYWKLTKTDILKSLVGPGPRAELTAPAALAGASADAAPAYGFEGRPALERRLSILPSAARLLIGEAVFRLPSVLSRSLRSWVADFRPDVIFSITANAPMLRTVTLASRMGDVPVVPYFTDDWIRTLYRDGPLSTLLRRSLLRWFGECLRRSPVRLAVCEAMRTEYEARYGGDFRTVWPPLDRAAADEVPPRPPDRRPVRLLYVGSLEPGRWRPLRAIGEALQALRAKGIEGELHIYAFPDEIRRYRRRLEIEPVLRVRGSAAPAETRRLQAEADVLVHIESFAAADREMTRYSLSTKIPQYLRAGGCLFGYGPGEIASIRYIEDAGAGVVVGKEDPALLRQSLQRVLADGELRLRSGRNALLAARTNHDRARMHEALRRAIIDAVGSWPAFRGTGGRPA
jgi:glycosyltransferase involved in cell wall biosynthesis